ncbi:Integrase catalytic region [Methylobacterium nodulans ORS 2060]|uniref:Integrase catalytic region n=1 Tax=Methylobacterium nodulans (strain LMG 21967 / CNCM I-2342 / ORS 2060) TaxID=460265 RepID=B8IAY7_METNO|nr:Integrase catalytic region [Methylobacterium nodulans ORS 2060]
MRERVVPWQEVSVIDNRAEFVGLAQQEAANVAALCRRFGISRKTGYKWLGRARSGAGLDDRSRRPHASPARTSPEMEEAVLELRTAHPSWGGRKLRRRLQDQGQEVVPAASTITAVLARHARLGQPDAPSIPFTRFEHPRPNALWQMDFKGHFAHAGGRCHPLTVLDDHSRYALCLAACADEVTATVQGQLSATFRRYGLPERINLDNGSPWGNGPGQRYTPLTVWLLRLGIHISHSRPYHPQTNGKDEGFHRTLKRDVLHGAFYASLAACQRAFDRFRLIYNCSSERTSRYAVDAKRLCCAGSGTAGCLLRFSVPCARARAAGLSRAARLNTQGPSARGCTASTSPRSAARRSVRAATPTRAAAWLRFSQGSSPSAPARNTGMR